MAKKPKKKVPKNVHDAAVILGKRAWVANPGMKKMKEHAKDKRKKKVQHRRFIKQTMKEINSKGQKKKTGQALKALPKVPKKKKGQKKKYAQPFDPF